MGGLLGEHYSWIGGRVNTPPTRPLDIVLTSNRKLGRGGVELRGAAPEKGRTNTQEKEPFGKKELSAHFWKGEGVKNDGGAGSQRRGEFDKVQTAVRRVLGSLSEQRRWG